MLEMIKNYVLVTKPAIVVGNVITAAGGFLLASRGRIDLGVLLSTLTGLSLVIASGCVFNNYVDRDMDRKMARTQNRVLPRGLLSPKAAVLYGSLIGVVGAVLLLSATTLLCAVIVLAGFTIYVGVYSVYLKRRSLCSTLIGSLAGAAPPLAGYCAVSNCFDMGALILLSIFSLWQMPHSYAIAIFRSTDYAAAAIPVMPVKRGTQAAKKRILSYMVAFVVATLMLTICGYTGYGYLAVAAASGLFWLYLAWAGYNNQDQGAWAKRVFVSSIFIIIALSVMMGFDTKGPEISEGFLASAQKPASVYGVGFVSGATAAVPAMLEERFSRSKQEIGSPGRRLTASRGLSVSKIPE